MFPAKQGKELKVETDVEDKALDGTSGRLKLTKCSQSNKLGVYIYALVNNNYNIYSNYSDTLDI